MSYQKLVTFGSSMTNSLPVYNNDPATFCVGTNASQAFNHGSNAAIYGQNSPECQIYMAQRCAKNWDGLCDYAASHEANEEYAFRADTMGPGMNQVLNLTPGQVLLRNTALEKYRTNMSGNNCQLVTEQFDPTNPSSPFMSYFAGYGCVPEYSVDAKTIDSDPVMNGILDQPKIAMQLLLNIKNTMNRKGTLGTLAGTRLGKFFRVKENFSDCTSCPPIESLVPLQISGLGLPGYEDYPQTPIFLDYWPTRYVAGPDYETISRQRKCR